MRSNRFIGFIEMPIHQHADHVSRAKEHIEQLKKGFLM
jgi:NAD+ synthase